MSDVVLNKVPNKVRTENEFLSGQLHAILNLIPENKDQAFIKNFLDGCFKKQNLHLNEFFLLKVGDTRKLYKKYDIFLEAASLKLHSFVNCKSTRHFSDSGFPLTTYHVEFIAFNMSDKEEMSLCSSDLRYANYSNYAQAYFSFMNLKLELVCYTETGSYSLEF